MSRELPILFNTDMVLAILDGRKGATRRIVKGFIPDDAIWGYTAFTPKGYISCRGTFADGYGEKFFKLPCEPGDILYIRETWSEWTDGYVYKAWNSPFPQAGQSSIMRWHPSIHMPKEAARIWLKVKDVRVERLQEITEEQAKAEGAIDNRGFIHSPDNEYDSIHTAKEHFKQIWYSTIKKPDLDRYGWDANPWVWVIEFERCEKPEDI